MTRDRVGLDQGKIGQGTRQDRTRTRQDKGQGRIGPGQGTGQDRTRTRQVYVFIFLWNTVGVFILYAVQGNLQKMRLQRRQYRICTAVAFFMIPCNYKLMSIFAKLLYKPFKEHVQTRRFILKKIRLKSLSSIIFIEIHTYITLLYRYN